MKNIFKLLIINVLVFIYTIGKSQTTNNDTTIIYKYNMQLKVLKDAKDYEKALTLNDSILGMTMQYSDLVKRQIWLDRAGIFTAQKKWDDAHEAYKYTDSITVMKTREDSIFKAELYFDQGLNYNNLIMHTEAINNYKQSLSIGVEVIGKDANFISNVNLNIGTSLSHLGNYDESINHYKEALRIKSISQGSNSEGVANCFHLMARCYAYLNQFEKAILHINEAINIREKLFGNINGEVASSYNVLGTIHLLSENNNLAYYYLNKAYEIRKIVFGQDSKVNFSSLINLATLKLGTFESEKALPYYLKALELLKQQNNQNLPNIYRGIGNCYQNLKSYDKALYYYIKADSISNVQGLGDEFKEVDLASIAEAYQNLGNLNLAKKYYLQSIDIEKGKSQNPEFGSVSTFMKLVRFYDLEDNYSSLDSLIVAYNIFIINDTTISNSEIYKYYGSIAEIYSKRDSFEKAINYINLSTKYLSETSEDVSPLENRTILTSTLKQHILAKLYKKTKDPYFYNESVEHAKVNLFKWNQLKSILNNTSFYNALNDLNYIYSNYIDILSENPNNLPKDSLAQLLFGLCEESKSYNLYKEHLKNSLSIDIDVENNIEIVNHQLLLLEKNQNKDSLYDIKKFNLLEKLDSLSALKSESISKSERFQQKSSIRDVQKNIDQNQSIVSYYIISEKNAFKVIVFHLTKENVDYVVVSDTLNIDDKINYFTSSITNYFLSLQKTDSTYITNIDKFCNVSNTLYEYFIKPIKENLKQDLTIIPDHSLSTFPFGALISKLPEKKYDFSTYKFLDATYDISYIANARFLNTKNNSLIQTVALNAYAPYATLSGGINLSDVRSAEYPIYETIKENKDVFTELPFSGREISDIAKITKGKVFIGKNATITNFLQSINSNNVVHIATHSKNNFMNKDLSFIAFNQDTTYGSILNLKDINKLKIKSDLIVLSSCESGAGTKVAGEGSISLNYGFMAAGAKSVISSLWPVNDQSTQILMSEFYTQLKAGKNKKQALRNAKLKLINGKNKSFRHPFYWSAFNLYGNTDTIKF